MPGTDNISLVFLHFKVKYQKEFKFLENRKFRFDYYFEIGDKKIGVEYDGLFSQKSRHTTVTGFTKDCEKLNLAQLNGYIVLRYTALNIKDFYNDLEKLINEAPRQDIF